MIKLFREYIKYLAIARQRHGVHSPFVYDFGDKCIKTTVPTAVWKEFKARKAAFRKSKQTIEVHDLGAGSKKLSRQRYIRAIARISGSQRKYAKLLYRLVAHYPVKEVLELGTSLGMGTFMLASGNKNVMVTSIEGCPNTLKVAKQYFPSHLKDRVHFIQGSFTETIQNLGERPAFDLIFIDGDHQMERLIAQIQLLTPYIHDETLILLDDIRWSDSMRKAWEYFAKHPDYHLTMDLFKMGIIAIRKHQRKEHFVVRY